MPDPQELHLSDLITGGKKPSASAPPSTPPPQILPQQAATAASNGLAEPILRSAQGIDDSTRANAWDAFHQSQNEDELSQRLQNINIPQDVKANLWDAKRSLAAPVQPPAQDLGRFQGAYELGQGAIKGAKETAQTAGKPWNWAADKIADSVGAPHDKPFAVPFQGEDTEPKTPLQMVGKGGESVPEFVLGDEALKGLSLAEKANHLLGVSKVLESSPKIAKAVEIGANAMRQGTVGAGQTLLHGGTPEQAATTGLVTGGLGATFETAGVGIKAIKDFVTRGPQVEQMGRELVSGLTAGATPEQVARTVGKNLADAEETMHSTYDAGIKKISVQGQSVPVPIAGSPLQQTATDLLSDSKIPGSVAESLKGVIPDADKIQPFQKQSAKSKEILSWDQMEATRQKIGQTIRKLPWDSPIRPDLIKVRYAIDDTLEKAAEKAGNTDLSDQIKSLRSEYAQTKGALEERAISALRDKNPNAIADVLLNKQSVHNVNTLRRLIGPDNMKVVEGSILDKMIQDASKNGELQGRQLFRKFNSLGQDAKQAIWGERLPQITQFMQQAGALPNVVLEKIVSHYAPYALGPGMGATYGAVTGFERDGVGGAAKGAVVGGATGMTITGLAALLRNPIVLDGALKGIQGLQKTVPPVASAVMTQNQSQEDTSGSTPSEDWKS